MEKEKNEDNFIEKNLNESDSSLPSIKSSEELVEELKIAKNEIEYYRNLYDDAFNKLKYSLADLDNYRKTAEKQNSLKILSLKSTLLSFVINIKEDFIRAIDILKQNSVDKAIFEGLENILKNISIFLEKEGIKEIVSLNSIFDPNIHEIIGFSYVDDIEENIITKEIRKGYLLNDRVLRPSLVEVSKKIVKNIDDNNNIKGDEI
ncbi:MAG TPA: nucleotide exchange factor GrpE [Verrucomicrobiae bacterium]|nr:nucleotide exchange factor GrpE [Verrucomicrobiae bacterium]